MGREGWGTRRPDPHSAPLNVGMQISISEFCPRSREWVIGRIQVSETWVRLLGNAIHVIKGSGLISFRMCFLLRSSSRPLSLEVCD